MQNVVDLPNEPSPAVPYFTPLQEPAAGTAVNPQPNGKPLPLLFSPLKIRGVEFQNRIIVPPLCQYSAQDGEVTNWHLAHLGGIFTRGPGLTYVEATAVLPEGRITPQDAGIWNEKHVAAWKNITDFAHSQNQKMGIQLAHAGRKASCVAPWLHAGMVSTEKVGGWPDNVWGPSDQPWNSLHPIPKPLTKEGIKRIVQAFADAAVRAVKAGFDVIQIHNAHGYLLSSFVSPATNKRTDEYGGSFENRIRLTLEIVDAVRAVIPSDMPLALRVTATDWLEEALPNEPSWTVEDTVKLAKIVAGHGVDLFDISSGGNHELQRLDLLRSNQSVLSHEVKKALEAEQWQVKGGGKLLVSVAGKITKGKQAESYLQEGRADFMCVGRQFQKDPGTVWTMAEDLDISIYLPKQIGWGFGGRGSTTSRKA